MAASGLLGGAVSSLHKLDLIGYRFIVGFFGKLRVLDKTIIHLLREAWRSHQLLASLPALIWRTMIAGLAIAPLFLSADGLRASYAREAFKASKKNDYPAAPLLLPKAFGPWRLSQGSPLLPGTGARQARSTGSSVRGPASPYRGGRVGVRAGPGLPRSAIACGERSDAKECCRGKGPARKGACLATTIRGIALDVGQVFVSAGNSAEAKPHLLIAAEAKPGLHLLLANLDRSQGNKESAREHANLAIAHFRHQLEMNSDDEPALLALAESYVILEDFNAAVAFLLKGLSGRDLPAIRNSLAEVYAQWAKSPALATDPKRRLLLLEAGLKCSSNHPELLKQVIEVAKKTGPKGEKAHAIMQQALADGPPSAARSRALGIG